MEENTTMEIERSELAQVPDFLTNLDQNATEKFSNNKMTIMTFI